MVAGGVLDLVLVDGFTCVVGAFDVPHGVVGIVVWEQRPFCIERCQDEP